MRGPILSYTLLKHTEATMIFQEYPHAFEIWKTSNAMLHIFKSNGKPLVTFHPFLEVFGNRVVRRTFMRANEKEQNRHPWMPVGVMLAHGVADWHDETDAYIIQKYRPVDAAPSNTEKWLADPISSRNQVSDQRVEDVS